MKKISLFKKLSIAAAPIAITIPLACTLTSCGESSKKLILNNHIEDITLRDCIVYKKIDSGVKDGQRFTLELNVKDILQENKSNKLLKFGLTIAPMLNITLDQTDTYTIYWDTSVKIDGVELDPSKYSVKSHVEKGTEGANIYWDQYMTTQEQDPIEVNPETSKITMSVRMCGNITSEIYFIGMAQLETA